MVSSPIRPPFFTTRAAVATAFARSRKVTPAGSPLTAAITVFGFGVDRAAPAGVLPADAFGRAVEQTRDDFLNGVARALDHLNEERRAEQPRGLGGFALGQRPGRGR